MGVRASGFPSRVYTDESIEKFKQKLEDYGIDVRMLKKYVDDVLLAVVNLPLGSRFCKDTGTITQ